MFLCLNGKVLELKANYYKNFGIFVNEIKCLETRNYEN